MLGLSDSESSSGDTYKIEKDKHKKMFLTFVMGVCLIIGTCGIYSYCSAVYKVCHVEAGVNVSANDFFRKQVSDAVFVEQGTNFNITKPGEYKVRLKKGILTFNSTLIIEDTIPPEAVTRNVALRMGERCEAEDFIEKVMDATEVKKSFLKNPDFTKPGEQEVEILIEDAGGNKKAAIASLKIIPVKEIVFGEAGETFPGEEAFMLGGVKGEFLTDVENIDMGKIGNHIIDIEAEGIKYSSSLQVKDTKKPDVTVKNLQGFTGIERKPEDFIEKIDDATSVSVKYEEIPDFEKIGSQEIKLLFTDEGENQVKKTAVLVLEEDTIPPVISGVHNITVVLGNAVSYKKGVKVTDNSGEEIKLKVDNSKVNINEIGSYPIIYTAVDGSGNETTQQAAVTVRPKEYSVQEVDAIADSILAGIIQNGMSAQEKAQAIYNWMRAHIAYISHSDKVSWIQSAYEGLALGKGDCYVFASTAKELLNRAGIPNRDIQKIPAKTMHFWNLVDVGNGWVHYDVTPRTDKPVIFLWSDAKLMEYSALHNNSHNYDHEIYQGVN